MTRVADEPGVVLHTRPYRESSLMVSLLTLHHGRVTLVARGIRGSRKGRSLQPFTGVRVGWSGRSSLGTLTGFEAIVPHWFTGNVLASAFYLTELIMRLIGEREVQPRLYAGLQWSFENIATQTTLVLRSFEKLLLEEMGYGLNFSSDVEGRVIEDDVAYRLSPDRGFIAAESGFSGRMLKRIGAEEFTDRAVRQVARNVFREALVHHLGPKPLMSRHLLFENRLHPLKDSSHPLEDR